MVPAISLKCGQIHPTDIGNLSIHHDRLLVVAMAEMRAMIESALQICARRSCMPFQQAPHRFHRAGVRLKQHGCAAPEKNAYRKALGGFGEQTV